MTWSSTTFISSELTTNRTHNTYTGTLLRVKEAEREREEKKKRKRKDWKGGEAVFWIKRASKQVHAAEDTGGVVPEPPGQMENEW